MMMITCFELGVSYKEMPYEKLEPYEGKLSRTVLRGGIGSNADLLPDPQHFSHRMPDGNNTVSSSF